MEIKVEPRDVYGAPALYPVCDQAKLICELLGTKTIPMTKVETLKKMGYVFVQVSRKRLAL